MSTTSTTRRPKQRQTMTLTVTTKSGLYPAGVVNRLLSEAAEVDSLDFEDNGYATDVPGPNRKRLIELATWVAGEDAKARLGLPSEWYQGAWLMRRRELGNQQADARTAEGCGTACCAAGKIAIEDGGVPVYDELGDWDRMGPGMDTGRVVFPEKGSEEVDVSSYAQEALGLTQGQAARLFSGSNRLDTMLDVIRDILAEDDEDEDEPQPEPVPVATRTVRRLNPDRVGLLPCSQGTDCDICYVDVEEPADEPELEDDPF